MMTSEVVKMTIVSVIGGKMDVRSKECMCQNHGNACWYDGTKSAYYDNYFMENRESLFGDINWSNRKYNTTFSTGCFLPMWFWECGSVPCSYI